MITTLCMNPCVDRTITLEALTVGGMNRAQTVAIDGAGKAVNVALSGRRIGLAMGCIGLLGESNGHLVKERLQAADVAYEFVDRPGSLRWNTKLVDQSQQTVTEINELGAAATTHQLIEVLELCRRWAGKSRAMVLTGSLLPQMPPNFYAQVMDQVRAECPECALVVDAEGETLAAVLDKKPYLIKPNRHELQSICRRELGRREDYIEEGFALVERGAEHVIVTLGCDGAFGFSKEGGYFAPALTCTAQSTVGAGDALVAAATGALLEGAGMEQALIQGVALATAAAVTPGTGWVDMGLYQEALKRVKPQPIE